MRMVPSINPKTVRRLRIQRPGTRYWLRAITLLLFASATHDVGTLTAQESNACAAPEYRQFDFWVGEWAVSRVVDDQVVASSSITSVLRGCAIHEDYKTQGGYAGYSYSAFDRVTGQWHQTWVDVGGLVLKIDGGIENGSMVLRGPGVNQDGVEILNEVTWTPHDDGTVQQTWRQSSDGGETWTTAFDGRYRRN